MKAIVSILLLLLAVLACVTPAEAQVGRDLLTRERRPRRERRGREDRPRRERRGREDRPRRERRPRGDDGERERDPRGDDGAMPPPMPTPTVTPTATPAATPANTTTPPTATSTTPPTATSTTPPPNTTTPAAPMPDDCPSILDLVAASEDLSTLGMAVQAAELGPLFSNKTAELTVLAPTNAAFDAVPAEALQALVEDKDALVAILGLHVIEGVVKAADLQGLTEAGAVTGTLGVSTDMGVSFTGPDGGSTANVVEADIMSCAGVVHKIDAVIVPGTPATEVPPGTTGTR